MHNSQISRSVGLAAFALLASGCNIFLDFEECARDSDCESGLCSDGICEPGDSGDEIVIDFDIDADTTWTKNNVYILDTVVSVAPTAVLTIEPGTEIRGNRSSALVVRAGGQLIARGTRDEPIVFTSAQPVGQRFAGDWGGVALLGNAPVNRENAFLDIIPNDMIAGRFGGDDPEWNCGVVEYVRVEFGGGQVEGEEALNGLTFAGCGSETVGRYIHVHFGADDGFEIFGGTMDYSHIVVSRAQDDGLDIDLGWVGKMQFLAVIQDIGGQNAIEVDNLQEAPNATPITDFEIYNYTLIATDDGPQRGITMKAGARGFFSHGIMVGHGAEAIDVFGPEAGDRAMAGEFTVQKTLFHDIGDDGTSYFPVAGTPGESQEDGTGDDDNGFEESTFQTDTSYENRFGVDPQLDDTENPLTNPDWIPALEAVTGEGVDAPPTGFDPIAAYMGAFSPNVDPWTEGWTDFPAN